MAEDKRERGSEGEPRRSGIAREGTKGTNQRERELGGGNEATGEISLLMGLSIRDEGKALRVKVEDGGSCT